MTSSIELRRDSQQWIFDWMVNETGKVFHFQGEERGALPKDVHTHAMISKALGKRAAARRRTGDEEAAAGHRITALEQYFQAATGYGRAQHVIFENNREKRFLHEQSLACYERVRELSPYPIERITVTLDGQEFTGLFHRAPFDGPAPLVFYVTGCDLTKEQYPHPMVNHPHQRGMHILSFDGPGQGESNLRGIALTTDNYERAASAMIDAVIQRPDVDAGRVVVYGQGFGSYWAIRIAATDSRVRAVVGTGSSICDGRYLFDRDSPRYKRLFAYLTQSPDEVALDAFIEAMDVAPMLGAITVPTLLTTGEYDPRNDLDELRALVQTIAGRSELWIFADQHHQTSYPGGGDGPLWDSPGHRMALDWLVDRLADGDSATGEPDFQVRYIDVKAGGPYGTVCRSTTDWFDR